MSDSYELLVLRAEWLQDAGELQQALDAWSDCIAARPGDWEARLARARAYLLLDQPAAAAIDLRRALESVPNATEVQALLASCEARVGSASPLPAMAVEIPLNGTLQVPPVQPPESLTLQSVAGQVELMAQVRSALDEWQQRRGKGVWGLGLVGPSGTARRFISHCIAGELGAEWIEADAATMAIGAVQAVQALVVRIAECRGPMVLFLESPDLVGVSDRALLGMLTHSLRKRTALLVASSAEPWLWDASLRRTLGLHRTLLAPPPDSAARRWFLRDPDPQSPYQAEVDVLVERTEGFTVDDLRVLMGPAFPLEAHANIDPYLDDRSYTLTPAYLLHRVVDVKASTPRWLVRALRERLDETLPDLAGPLQSLARRLGM